MCSAKLCIILAQLSLTISEKLGHMQNINRVGSMMQLMSFIMQKAETQTLQIPIQTCLRVKVKLSKDNILKLVFLQG